MPLTSVAQANSKTAEFARLFDLFDRVATRRTRRALAGDTNEVISADDIAGVPAEFAPVLRNLSTVLNVRARRDQSTSTTLIPSAPNTPCTVTELMDGVQEEYDTPSFPLEERYPFTFKLMLHKLYDLDEWAEKVKHAVETSKSQFKPLAERVQNVVKDATAEIKQRGRKKENGKSKPSTTTRHARAMPPLGVKTEASRVLKKRCIGRRKSVSGPLSTGVWVYDAAVSATEVTVPRSAGWAETFSTPRWPTGVQNRTRHQSLPAFKLEEMQPRDTARRKIKHIPPRVCPGAFESVTPQSCSALLVEPAQVADEKASALNRTRTKSMAFTSELRRRAPTKRALCT